MAGLAEENKKYRQLLIKKPFEQLCKVVENTKVVHYFDNSKGNFFRGPNHNGLVQNLSTSRGRHLSALGCGKSEQEWIALCKNIYICAELNPQNGFIVIFK